MARTNKMGILKQKQQAAKQKKMIGNTPSADEHNGIKHEYTNPKGNSYLFFKRAGKWICDMTNCREDGDGYRLVGKPNSGDVDFVYKGTSSRGFRKFTKTFAKTKISKKS